MDLDQIWQAVLGELEVNISKPNFTTWFKDTFIVSFENGIVTIGVPSAFNQEWLSKKFHSDIYMTLKKHIPELRTIEYKITTRKIKFDNDNNIISLEKSHAPAQDSTGLKSNYLFTNFVVGNSNKLAHAASLAVAENPGTAYNPLFIYGGSGLGKTHLLHAIGNEITQKHPGKKLLYTSCDNFTNEFVQSIKTNTPDKFKNKYRKLDVFLIDDIQFFTGKSSTKEEFFHTFNALYQANKQIVMTSDRPPKALPALEERLRSRFEGGMIADIAPPDYEMRKAILLSKAAEKNFELPDEVLDLLAENIQQNIRELEGALTRIIAYLELNNEAPSIDSVTRALGGIISPKPADLDHTKIIDVVCKFYDIEPSDLLSKKRVKELVIPRQIAMYLLKNELSYSFPQIAIQLGKKDHTTIMYGYNKIKQSLKSNKALSKEINMIKERLY